MTPDGYRIHLHPGDHPMVRSETVLMVPYDSPKIRVQLHDLEFHPCIGWNSFSGMHRVICLYVPFSGG